MEAFVFFVLSFLSLRASGQCLTEEFLSEVGVKQTPKRDTEIIFAVQNWKSHFLNSHVAGTLLSQVMGYEVRYDDFDTGSVSFENAETDTIHIDVELWFSGKEQLYKEFVIEKGTVADAGGLGINGRVGWFVSDVAVGLASDCAFPDFWRSYSVSEDTIDLFTGTPPEARAGMEPYEQFIPEWCEDPPSPCMEVISYETSWDQGIMQQQIRNNGWNMTISFMGNNTVALLNEYFKEGKPVVFYQWEPSSFTASHDVSRIALKAYSDECFADNTGSLTGHGSVDCDFAITQLYKIVSKTLFEDPDYTPAGKFIRSFTISLNDINEMLASERELEDVACDWIKSNSNKWSDWIVDEFRVIELLESKFVVPVIAINSVTFVITFICSILVILKYRHVVFRASSNLLCVVMVYGSLMILSSIYILAQGQQARGVCFGYGLMSGLGFMLVIAPLAVKTWRVQRIFLGGKDIKKNYQRITNTAINIYISILAVAELLIHLVRLGADPALPILVEARKDVDFYECRSVEQGAWSVLLIAPKALILLYTVVCAFRVRKVHENYNESKYIFLTVNVIAVIALIATVMLNLMPSSPNAAFALTSMSLILGTINFVAVFFVPKFYNIYVTKEGERRSKEGRFTNSKADQHMSRSGSGGGSPTAHRSTSMSKSDENRTTGDTAV